MKLFSKQFRKTFDTEEIKSQAQSLSNSPFLFLSEGITEALDVEFKCEYSKVIISFTEESFKEFKKLMIRLAPTARIFIYNNKYELVLKTIYKLVSLDGKKIIFPLPANALLPERRKHKRRQVMETIGHIHHENQKYKFNFIDFHEFGTRIRLHSAFFNDEFNQAQLAEGLEIEISFKNRHRKYSAQIISNTTEDKYIYLGLKFLENVYDKVTLIPEHLDF